MIRHPANDNNTASNAMVLRSALPRAGCWRWPRRANKRGRVSALVAFGMMRAHAGAVAGPGRELCPQQDVVNGLLRPLAMPTCPNPASGCGPSHAGNGCGATPVA